jgi:hypothetical protein
MKHIVVRQSPDPSEFHRSDMFLKARDGVLDLAPTELVGF